MLITPNVRFGSKADMCAAKSHVRFTPPKADINASIYGDHSTSDHISPLIVR